MARKAALAPVSAGRSRRAVGVSFYSLPLSPYGPDIHQVIEHTFARFKQKLTDLVFNECQKRGEPSLTAPLVRGLVVEVVATKKIIAADVKRLGNDDWVPPPAGSSMYGGGTYDVGAAFAGGGFMPTQQEPGGGSGGRSGRQNKEQTLRAVTVRQLAAAAASNPMDTELVVDGHDLANVTLLGKVVVVSERSGNLDLRIDDGTGTMEATVFLENPDDPNAVAQKMAELRPGTYVRVYGAVKGYDGRWSINAFAVRVVHDYNEVTYHFLQVVFQHLHLLKGGGTGVGGAGAPPAAGGGFGGAVPPAAGGWQQHMQAPPPQQHQPGGYGGAPPAGQMGGGGGAEACQAAVLQILSSPACGEAGLHVNDISNRVAPSGFTRAQVEQALKFLEGEAHAYTTSDDMHWRPAV